MPFAGRFEAGGIGRVRRSDIKDYVKNNISHSLFL